MRNNAFTDILLNWEKMSNNKKIQRLQDLENMIARFQGRPPKTVTTKVEQELLEAIGQGREPEACYNRRGGKIYFFDLKMSAIDAIKNIIHEGFHAYVDDFIQGKAPVLKTYSKVEQERFFIEEENLDAIRTTFSDGDSKHPKEQGGFFPLFDSMYIEELLNYQEDSMYIVKNILDSIDSIPDAIKLQQAYIFAFGFDVDNELRARKYERQYGTTYESLVVDALNHAEDFEKVDMSKCGKISDKMDPEFLEFYQKGREMYKRFVVAQKNPLLFGQAKEEQMSKAIDAMMIHYRDYVVAMLKNKKKS